MNAIKATIRNGRLDVKVPTDWPEGGDVLIEPIPRSDCLGMTEAEQSDDPEAIARWIAELEAIPPLPMTAAEEADMLAWRQKVKEYNLEAVRCQMNGDRIE